MFSLSYTILLSTTLIKVVLKVSSGFGLKSYFNNNIFFRLRSFDYSSMVCNPFLNVDEKLLSKTVNDSALDFLSKVG